MQRRRARNEDKRKQESGPSWPSQTSSSDRLQEPPAISSLDTTSRLWTLFEYILPQFAFRALVALIIVLSSMPNTSSFDPARDVPDLAEKVIFITGGTAGLGKGSILALAAHSPAHIVFSGRNQKSAEALIATAKEAHPTVTITFLECDLSSLASTQSCAHQFLAKFSRLDVLMCNAGIMAVPAGTSKDGYEMQFATNHLGHALLTKLLLPRLEATEGSRIVVLSSIAYSNAPRSGIDFATLKSSQPRISGLPFPPLAVWERYGQSKLANLLYARALAQHHPSVTTVAVHPGVINTGLFAGLPFYAKPAAFVLQTFAETTPVERGHLNQVWAATCPRDSLVNGAYYEPIGNKVTAKTKHANDAAMAEKLWTWTEEALAEYK